MTRLLSSVVVLSAIISVPAFAQRDWNAPFPAHHVIDNIYFVGTQQLGTFLITTPEGHILINSDFESTVPSIRQGVEALGFDFADIEIILGSHAHGDHMEADALVKELTGAEVIVMRQDVERLRTLRPDGKPHPIDRILDDADEVTLGEHDARGSPHRRPHEGLHKLGSGCRGERRDLSCADRLQFRCQPRIYLGRQSRLP